jgi:DNA-binding transcriptional LysR family regulator
MIARRSCEILAETSRFFTKHQVRPRFSLRSDNDSRCLQIVAAGLGITNAPRSLRIDGTMPLAVVGYDFHRRLGLRLGQCWAEDAVDAAQQAAQAFRSACIPNPGL